MRWLIVLAVLGGCYSPRGTRCEPCSGVEECPGGLACIAGKCRDNANECDVQGDGNPLQDARICYGVNQMPLVELCPMGFSDAVTNLPATFNTDFQCTYAVPATANTPALCVVLADHIAVREKTRVTGSRTLVLLARTRLEIDELGELDLAGSSMSGEVPAGANVASCTAPHGTDATGGSTGGGGPGGTFRGRGGTGAAGNGTVAVMSTSFEGGELRLRGGCRGGDGGKANTNPPDGGPGGTAGGAIYLLAPSMTINGVVNASGGGARAAVNPTTGGGGGGSGGMILIWTMEPLAFGSSAQLFALGGGGGSGGSSTLAGIPGDDPDSPTSPAIVSIAPVGAGNGGRGGSASQRDGGAGVAPTGTGGGGGGGGGVGYIQIYPPLTLISSQIAPTPSS